MLGATMLGGCAAARKAHNNILNGNVYNQLCVKRTPAYKTMRARRSLTSSAVLRDRAERGRGEVQEALAEPIKDTENIESYKNKGFDPFQLSTQVREQLSEQPEFREAAATERRSDGSDSTATEGPKNISSNRKQRSGASDFSDSQQNHQHNCQTSNGALRKKGFNKYPASFVLPTTVPYIKQLAKSEAQHRQKLLHLLKQLNLPPFLYSFAYGSGVFSQTATAKKQPDGTPPMIDMVVAVQNPVHWHTRNMINNPNHYPWWLRWSPLWFIEKVQNMGAGVWYIPYVKADDEVRECLIQIIKYGVVSVDSLCKDLLHWETLYLSGRMHKPIATLFDSTEGRVPLAEQANLSSALRVSFLLLPEQFSEEELYTKMASLSYLGDFRMHVPGGENKNKVRNIVQNQYTWFRFMCADLITRFRYVTVESTPGEKWLQLRVRNVLTQQNVSPNTRASFASNLPLTLRKRIIRHYLTNPAEHPLLKDLASASPEDLKFEKRQGLSENISASSAMEAKVEKLARGVTMHDDQLPPLVTRFWLAVVQQESFNKVLEEQLIGTVKKPAETQSLKGLHTAGIQRSVRYLLSKLSKVCPRTYAVSSGTTILIYA